MVEPLVLNQVAYATAGPKFRLCSTVHQPSHAAENQCTGAHHARFHGHIQRTVVKIPVTQPTGGLAHGQEFGVGAHVLEPPGQVVAPSEYPVVKNDHCSDRHLIVAASLFCLGEGLAHVDFIEVEILQVRAFSGVNRS